MMKFLLSLYFELLLSKIHEEYVVQEISKLFSMLSGAVMSYYLKLTSIRTLTCEIY